MIVFLLGRRPQVEAETAPASSSFFAGSLLAVPLSSVSTFQPACVPFFWGGVSLAPFMYRLLSVVWKCNLFWIYPCFRCVTGVNPRARAVVDTGGRVGEWGGRVSRLKAHRRTSLFPNRRINCVALA